MLFTSMVLCTVLAQDLEWWPDSEQPTIERVQEMMLAGADPDRLRADHEALAGRPHRAGSPGDRAVIELLAGRFAELGLEVERHEFDALLPEPVAGAVRMTSPVQLDLPVREAAVEEDPFSSHPELSDGWNAYSASGEASGQVVYANYGRKSDFERLEELGVSCAGRIVVARYGGNFRGFKAKFAQQAGAIGLIIYYDPKDVGYVRGLMYPEGGWANATSIQRGSIVTLPYPGDPLTPGRDSGAGGHLAIDEIELPRIPVQPVGWAAAEEILSRMTGRPVGDAGWQGGLPFTYRLTGGSELLVEVSVKQRRRLQRTANVTGTLRGREEPDRYVVIGCHHDAWGFGAADPLCGMIVVLETARVFAELAADGWRPRRSIVFAGWAAEEYGIVGSTEWAEAHRERLGRGGVAYLNLDMASMGVDFGASASPSLKPVIHGTASAVPHPSGGSVLDDWARRSEGEPSIGALGGGSDHVGFLCHLGVPCAGFRGGGVSGTSYHSAYDTLTWYRMVVGDTYASARLLTQLTCATALRLADAPVLALSPGQCGAQIEEHLRRLSRKGERLGSLDQAEGDISPRLAPVATAAVSYAARADELVARTRSRMRAGELSDRARGQANDILIALERAWLDDAGLPGRAWYRNLYAASDENSGYAAWVLPGLHHTIEADGDTSAMVDRYLAVFDRLALHLDALERILAE